MEWETKVFPSLQMTDLKYKMFNNTRTKARSFCIKWLQVTVYCVKHDKSFW